MFKLEIRTGGAAFHEEGEAVDEYGRIELIRILQKIERELEDGYDSHYIMDINGNKVGEWAIS